jgi:arylsulfatase A-like enzyme
MKGIGAGLAVAFAPRIRAADAPAEGDSRSRPNIVFVLLDDLGYGQPPCYRAGSEFKTPNMDQLVREGMRFTDAHAAAAVCTPTRYGVLTGRYPSRIGQYGVLTTFSPPIIERQRLTVGSFLQKQGYHTACIGKWHLGMKWPALKGKKGSDSAPVGTAVTEGPTTRGFDYFCGYTHARNIGMIIEQDKVVVNVAAVEAQPLLAKKVVAYIDERAKAGKPFFIYLPLSPPHTPIVPAEDFKGKTTAGAYGDWIYQGDWVVGQVMEALKRNKLAENTLLIVTSDNGAEGRAYAPLRGSKRSIYEGGHREPFIARWPGKVKPGSVCDDTICLNDLLATCAEIVDAKLPDNAAEDSFSILPDLLGTAKGPVREATIHQSMAGDLAIRQGPWKLIFMSKGGGKELYNLNSDLSETRDVAAEQPEVVQRLEKLMRQYIDNGRSTPGPRQKNGVDIQVNDKSGLTKLWAGRRDKARARQELANAADPTFD